MDPSIDDLLRLSPLVEVDFEDVQLDAPKERMPARYASVGAVERLARVASELRVALAAYDELVAIPTARPVRGREIPLLARARGHGERVQMQPRPSLREYRSHHSLGTPVHFSRFSHAGRHYLVTVTLR